MVTETVKRSIKLTIKTSKLAEIASRNIIYISSCINQIIIKLTERARVAVHHTSPMTGIAAASKLIFFNKVIAFGTFMVKAYTHDSSSFHFAI